MVAAVLFNWVAVLALIIVTPHQCVFVGAGTANLGDAELLHAPNAAAALSQCCYKACDVCPLQPFTLSSLHAFNSRLLYTLVLHRQAFATVAVSDSTHKGALRRPPGAEQI